MGSNQATDAGTQAHDRGVEAKVLKKVIARAKEYAQSLRAGGEDASGVEGFPLVLEVEPLGRVRPDDAAAVRISKGNP